MKLISRDEARIVLWENGITVDSITVTDKRNLHKCISERIRASENYMGTMRMNRMTAKGDMRCSSYHFTSREVISFNSSGFIGIAGWADDGNVRPILDGIGDWLESKVRK